VEPFFVNRNENGPPLPGVEREPLRRDLDREELGTIVDRLHRDDEDESPTAVLGGTRP
jgi:hypothetical protein